MHALDGRRPVSATLLQGIRRLAHGFLLRPATVLGIFRKLRKRFLDLRLGNPGLVQVDVLTQILQHPVCLLNLPLQYLQV